MIQSENKHITLLLSSIVILTIICYSIVINHEFVNWDDAYYINDNPILDKLSLETLFNYFESGYYLKHTFLSFISYSVDYSISEYNPSSYHFSNIIIHLINTILVFIFVYILTERQFIAGLTTLLFGISTMNVEVVAWISERNHLLYTFFFLLALIYYLKHLMNINNISDRKKYGYYYLCLLFFTLSLLSKQLSITFIGCMFAIDYLLNRNLMSRKVLFEKIPFVFFAILILGYTFFAISVNKVGTTLPSYSFFERIIYAGFSYTQYIIKSFIPYKLSAIYLYPEAPGVYPSIYYWIISIVSIICIPITIYFHKRNRIVSFSIIFFTFNIFPILQLFPYHLFLFADRYNYLPSVSLYLILSLSILHLYNKKSLLKRIIVIFTIMYILTISIFSYKRVAVWKNSINLWSDVIKKSPNIKYAWINLADAKMQKGFLEEALPIFNRAIELDSNYEATYINRGKLKIELQDYDGALSDINKAISINEESSIAHLNKGVIFLKKELTNSAINEFNLAIKYNPISFKAYKLRGDIHVHKLQYKKAVKDYIEAINIHPNYDDAYTNLGSALYESKKFDDAIISFTKAIEICPNNYLTYYNRANAYYALENYLLAIKDYNKSITLNNLHASSYYNRGATKYALKEYIGACEDWWESKLLGQENAQEQLIKHCQ